MSLRAVMVSVAIVTTLNENLSNHVIPSLLRMVKVTEKPKGQVIPQLSSSYAHENQICQSSVPSGGFTCCTV